MKPAKQQTIIDLKDVWKIYQIGEVEVPALRGLNLEIRKGEFLAVMGASGSGKSTLLNSMGCLDIPTKGKIMLENRNISFLPESELAQIRGRKIGFVFQMFNLIPSLTALENITLPMTFQDVEEERRKKRAMRLLEAVGLKERATHLPSQLSGGETQRVAIARALANNPDVVLADEPTGNLDSKTGMEILNLLKDLHKKEGKTIVMVTHDAMLAKEADRVAHLKDGQIVDYTKNGRLKVPEA